MLILSNKCRRFLYFFMNSGASPYGVGLFVVPHFRAPFLRYATERHRRHYYPLRSGLQVTDVVDSFSPKVLQDSSFLL